MKQWTADELLAIGERFLRIGQYPAAIQIASLANEETSIRHAAVALMGDAFAEQGDYRQARVCYDGAIELAVRAGLFEKKLQYQSKAERVGAEIDQEALAVAGDRASEPERDGTTSGDRQRLEVIDASRREPFKILRKILKTYALEDMLLDLCERIPAHENELSQHRSETAFRQREAIGRNVPTVCLCTLPKSGTMFLTNRFTEALDAPFVRVSVGLFPKDRVVPSWARFAGMGGCVAVQHMDGRFENLRMLHDSGLRKAWLHVRDPRQALLSFHHHLNSGDPAVAIDMDPAYYRLSNTEKIDYQIQNWLPNAVVWMNSWIEAIENPEHGLNILATRHRELATDARSFFDRVCAFYEIDPSLFGEAMISRPKQGSSHFRKGETDEWRQAFTDRQKAQMDEIIPSELLNYFAWER